MRNDRVPALKRQSEALTHRRRQAGFPITALGALLLFASWLTENQFAQKFASDRARLELSQSTIALEEMRMTLWLIPLYQEREKDSPDRRLLASFAFKAFQAHANIIAWSEARLLKESATADQNPFPARNAAHKLAADLFAKQDVEGLLRLIDEATRTTNLFGRGLIDDFTRQLGDVRQKEEFWSRCYLAAYIVGSIMIGIGTVVTHSANSAGKLGGRGE